MIPDEIQITLLSETTFGRGDGVAGLIDEEVQHDVHGFPYLAGRTLKGLLQECCADIYFSAQKIGDTAFLESLSTSALALFGQSGALLSGGQSNLHIGNAVISPDLQEAIRQVKLDSTQVLSLFTTLRRQTQIEPNGVAKENSLRTARVILRETVFYAPLVFIAAPAPETVALLAACVSALRQAGSSRNRGTGWVQAKLFAQGQDITSLCLENFEKQVNV
ncbi:MAG TPA: hypothetical protein PK299_10725 [Anaerolineales bacterium]|nr:hypothetical protein [Anaerolineales bacterium]